MCPELINPLLPITVALLCILALLVGLGAGWFLGRRARTEEQELLHRVLEERSACWVKHQVDQVVSVDEVVAASFPDTQ